MSNTTVGNLTKDYEDDELEKIYSKEHIERQKLIQPVEPTWEQRLNVWKKKEYKAKEFGEGISRFYISFEKNRTTSKKISGIKKQGRMFDILPCFFA